MEAILKIEDVEMPVSLLVVNSIQKNILLGMDWFDMYDVALDIPTREIMFVIGRQRIKTYVHFEKGELINCITMEESQEQRQPGAEGLSAAILCNNVQGEMLESELNSEKSNEKQRLDRYLEENPNLIFTDERHATKTDLVHCKLWMKNDQPFRTRVRPLSPEKRKALQKEIDELLDAGVIRPSKSVYASAPVLVKKKDGTWRLAIDYRKANDNSEDFPYPLPLIKEIFGQFYGATYYSSLDLAWGYWQITMDPGSIQYTAFITPFAQFELLVMPFGLKQAPG